MAESSDPDLSLSQLAFLLADMVEGGAKFKTADWTALGAAGDAIKKVIADQNIDLTDPEIVVEIHAIKYAKESGAVVDLIYEGGGAAPDPFRFVYLVANEKYIGYAGTVLS